MGLEIGKWDSHVSWPAHQWAVLIRVTTEIGDITICSILVYVLLAMAHGLSKTCLQSKLIIIVSRKRAGLFSGNYDYKKKTRQNRLKLGLWFLSPPVPMHGGLICITFRL